MSTASTCTFTNHRGAELHARLVVPRGRVRATALFAHCFTCGKDLRVERQLIEALVGHGYAVLSFDFAGLGRSGGDFADRSFASDTRDLEAAAAYLGETLAPPSLLVGHSLGGAAVLSVAPRLDGVCAVATIGAPCDPGHVAHLLDGDLDSVRRQGSGEVTIGGRTFTISAEFLEQLDEHSPEQECDRFRGATLLMHSPHDEMVGIDNAERLYRASRHPKSFVSLDDADHLVTDPADAAYAATVIASWASRYLPEDDVDPHHGWERDGAVAVNRGGFATEVQARGFSFIVDEPVDVGGSQLGPTPYEHLAVALASCTAMTMRMYADRKGWEVGDLEAEVTFQRVHAKDCAECDAGSGRVERFDRELRLPADLSEEQREKLVEIADKCPVHRTFEGQIEVHTSLG